MIRVASRENTANIAGMTATAHYAFDKRSARSFDADGRMRVRDCVISVAEINPYFGREIPGNDVLGLDPAAVYDLYRDPEELRRAADDFNGMPIMIRHVAQTADNPRKDYQAGSVFNARFDGRDLRADLLVTDRQAIDLIESGELADLSSSYRYRADMTPTTVAGQTAHGVMRDIRPNHVALVEDGRATGAHVADSALKPQTGDTTVENEEIGKALAALAEKLEDCLGRLSKLEGTAAGAQDEQSEKDREDEREGEEAHLERERKDREDEREGEEAHLERERKDREDERKGELAAMDANSVKALVDAAVRQERERASAVLAARTATRHVLGDTIAMDSAGEIYRAALEQSGVNVAHLAAGTEQIAWDAYRAATSAAARPHLANDSAAGARGEKPRFNTDHIGRR